MNRSVTGCVPALGGGLPCPGLAVSVVHPRTLYYNVLGSSMNRSVTSCVPALGSGLSCPGISRVEHGLFRLCTAQEPDSMMLSRISVSASALTAPGSIGAALCANSGAASEPRGRRIITSDSTVSSSKASSSSDRSQLIFRLLWSNRPHSLAPQ